MEKYCSLLKIKDSPLSCVSFSVHNLMIPTESSIRHALVPECHVYNMLEILSMVNRDRIRSYSKKGEEKPKELFNGDKERLMSLNSMNFQIP
jgi:hypothetical protein